MFNWTKCPEQYKEGLQMYFLYHVEPGSFMRAVLENDLHEAMARFDGFSSSYFSDTSSMRKLQDLMSFLYNEVPARTVGIWGTHATVEKWLKARESCSETAPCEWHTPKAPPPVMGNCVRCLRLVVMSLLTERERLLYCADCIEYIDQAADREVDRLREEKGLDS